ncbi:type II toxin-antitoxin system VapB family antitoxin [Bradyrhizobium sp. S3.12.5]
MIATISIDDELFAQARQFVGVAETSAVVVLRAPGGPV